MDTQSVIVILLLGAVAGWLGSLLYQGSGLGLIGNIVVGIIGGFIGTWLLGKLGISFGKGVLGYILTAASGAVVLLALLNLLIPRRK